MAARPLKMEIRKTDKTTKTEPKGRDYIPPGGIGRDIIGVTDGGIKSKSAPKQPTSRRTTCYVFVGCPV
jgi:hypothetical protein